MSITPMIETLQQARELRDVAHIRRLAPRQIVTDYAAYATSQFRYAYAADTVQPLLIPARNEEEDLPATLLAAARAGDLFPVVLDNKSSDDTALIARKMGAGVIDISTGNKMAATQEGIRLARHDLGARAIFLTDADTLMPANWAKELNGALLDHDDGTGSAVFGNSILWNGTKPLGGY